MAYSEKRELAWSRTLLHEDYYNNERTKLSLIKRGINHPSSLQFRLEKLFLLHQNLKGYVFLGDLSEQEVCCLLLAAWGVGIKECANILKIKEDTVHKIRTRACQKLNAIDIPNAVFKASEVGIFMVDSIDFIIELRNKKTQLIQKNIKTEEMDNA
ncbi:helix-turn-helix transcriptional regulator [Rickettsiella endosymbiont of Dermanyssus gallinae]|uniref:helix-turn-helix transcriptional regulator n=1 Tax=Rickettsiella endosymbiont of Dermanyssus gallinae TaxID=2856608 RepID=UPI001C53125B|nr:LuxR C-terminal-related transcriptional regulator [Rickettsiella endosymbiont of Dermanyssus gallinae]